MSLKVSKKKNDCQCYYTASVYITSDGKNKNIEGRIKFKIKKGENLWDLPKKQVIRIIRL